MACWSTAGRPIQCCGHGLLCCAALWTGLWGEAGELTMSGGRIYCSRDGERVWLGFTPVELTPQPPPAWLAGKLELPGTHSAISREADGYLVVEVAEGSNLRELQPPGEDLARYTERALIVTCPDSEQNHTVRFRYFAPQYGVAEDMATGSAMRVLASYWDSRGLGPQLEAHQHSAAGGLLFSCLQDGLAWVGGYVEQHTGKTVT